MSFIYSGILKPRATRFHHTTSSSNQIPDFFTFSNFTNAPSLSIAQFYLISKWSNVILMTLIALIGLYGNTMSIFIFSSKSFNKNSSKSLRTYLLILSLSDLFVIILHYIDFTFRSWINLTGMYSSNFNFVDKIKFFCRIVPYFRNVFRTVSVYTLLLMTIQRLFVLYFPLARKKWFSVYFNRTLVKWLFIVSLCVNLSTLFVNDLVEHDANQELHCSIKKKNLEFQLTMDILFAILTILVPCMLISVITVVLYLRIKECLNYRKIDELNVVDRASQECSISRSEINLREYRHSTPVSMHPRKKKYSVNSVKITYMLVVLSKWYIMLHLPYSISVDGLLIGTSLNSSSSSVSGSDSSSGSGWGTDSFFLYNLLVF
ncbi:allatostatin-A receptor isoform X1 [Brachionus plicatilis]|uniref:Allatostatin-A receptor isoform X1 n=1 Tax=Brachionus plicatilis TaxID=10195 RepID=A0A3M7T4Z5_BRAPC|nr:allatostatin-A receptor isoform X1 [Brachionus plicatilis]